MYWERHALGGRLKFLGSGLACSDYVSILTSPVDQKLAITNIGAEIDRLLQRRSIFSTRQIQLEGIETTSEWYQEFTRQLRQKRFSLSEYPLQSSYQRELPGDWDSFMAMLGKSFRRKCKKLHLRLSSGEIQFHRVSTPAEIADRFATLVMLHQKRRHVKGEPGSFADPRFAPFLKSAAMSMAGRGMAEIQWIERDGHVLAQQLCFIHEQTLSMYLTGMDCDFLDQEPGFTAVAASINNAIERGLTCYDFLRGDEPYKQLWRGQPRPLTRTHITPPQWTSQGLEAVFAGARSAKQYLKHLRSALLNSRNRLKEF
jgi:CelD/BcsL family acetyltransferase involved in cellulose biosynthesis